MKKLLHKLAKCLYRAAGIGLATVGLTTLCVAAMEHYKSNLYSGVYIIFAGATAISFLLNMMLYIEIPSVISEE